MLVTVAYEDILGSPYVTWTPKVGAWHSVHEGVVIYRGRYPHFGAARALLALGFSPDEPIRTTTRHGTTVFESTVGRLASLSVKETKDGKIPPTIQRYTPRPESDEP